MKYKYSPLTKPFHADADEIKVEVRNPEDYNIFGLLEARYCAYDDCWWYDYEGCGIENGIDVEDIVSWEYVNQNLNDL